MKSEHLSDAIGKVDGNLIAEADRVRGKKRKPRWIAWVAAAACIAIAFALAKPLLLPKESPGSQSKPVQEHREDQVLGKPTPMPLYDSDHSIAYAVYPFMEKYPDLETLDYDWDAFEEQMNKYYESKDAYAESLTEVADQRYFDDFYKKSATEFLSQAGDENLVYSPSNVYMALAMIAEVTDGNSRQQILDLLGAESIEQLRSEAKYLWGSNYCDDGLLTTVMANSMWLADNLPYNQETLERLAKEYYASSFSGVMGSEEYSEMLRQWLNEQTGNLLTEQTKELSFDPSTIMALASTVYFKGQWTDGFPKTNTKQDTFYATTGETRVDFMNISSYDAIYWGESYTAIEKDMEGSASMWLVLPDEDKTVTDVLNDGEVFDMTKAGASWTNCKNVTVNLSMPKFDVTSNIDLKAGLIKLGVTDVFDVTRSDFTPLTDLPNLYVGEAEHAARVTLDEEGCTAAAYTVLMMEAGDAVFEGDEVDFILNRPFIFVITGCGDQPLFVGVVNQV